jgi:hypothetical protein
MTTESKAFGLIYSDKLSRDGRTRFLKGIVFCHFIPMH